MSRGKRLIMGKPASALMLSVEAKGWFATMTEDICGLIQIHISAPFNSTQIPKSYTWMGCMVVLIHFYEQVHRSAVHESVAASRATPFAAGPSGRLSQKYNRKYQNFWLHFVSHSVKVT